MAGNDEWFEKRVLFDLAVDAVNFDMHGHDIFLEMNDDESPAPALARITFRLFVEGQLAAKPLEVAAYFDDSTWTVEHGQMSYSPFKAISSLCEDDIKELLLAYVGKYITE